MFYMAFLFLFMSVLSLVGVAMNPAPNHAALNLVLVAGSGCGLLAVLGSLFFSLILFLVYLGGMLVVFAYSVAFTHGFDISNLAEFYGFERFIPFAPFTGACYMLATGELKGDLLTIGVDFKLIEHLQGPIVSVSILYAGSVSALFLSCLALLVSLLVVLVVALWGGRGGGFR